MHLEGLKLKAEWISNRPDGLMSGRGMDHWKCRLLYEGRSLTFYYSMGIGHHGRTPEVAHVLESLMIDANSYLDNDFESFCDELGYSTDSIQARKTFNACGRILKSMIRLVGQDNFNQLDRYEEA